MTAGAKGPAEAKPYLLVLAAALTACSTVVGLVISNQTEYILVALLQPLVLVVPAIRGRRGFAFALAAFAAVGAAFNLYGLAIERLPGAGMDLVALWLIWTYLSNSSGRKVLVMEEDQNGGTNGAEETS